MKTRVIICGMSRSGTSILYTLLSNTIDGVEQHESETSAMSIDKSENISLTKRPLDCMQLDKIFDTFKNDNIKIIFQIRDPRDVICSSHISVPHDYFIGYQNQYFLDASKNIAVPVNPGLGDIVRQWLKYKDNPNVFTLKYEKLILEKDKTIRALASFLDLEINLHEFDISEKTKVPNLMATPLNGIRKLDKNSIGSWKKHPHRIWDEFTSHKEMHELMRVLGYEQSPNWFFERFQKKLPIQITNSQ